MNNLSDMLYEYGCKIYKYSNLKDVIDLISRYNKIIGVTDDLLYLSCKDDAGVFVIVTNKYVIKLYKPLDYKRIVDLYRPITTNNNFEHIEKIYYYYSVTDGYIEHDTYSKDSTPTDPTNQTTNHTKPINIHGVINELLIPITRNILGNRGMEIHTDIKWNKDTLKKLLLDVAEGLDILHHNGTIHNDTTPDNIGLRPSDSNFVLFDFGQSTINNKPLTYEAYKVDVNRFLYSLMNLYKDIIPFRSILGTDYLINIYKYVNAGPYYIGKFNKAI